MSRLIRPCPKCPGYYYEGEACRCCAAIAQARREAESEALEVLRDLSVWVGHAKYSQPLKDYTADEWADCIREQVDVRWGWSRREAAEEMRERCAQVADSWHAMPTEGHHYTCECGECVTWPLEWGMRVKPVFRSVGDAIRAMEVTP